MDFSNRPRSLRTAIALILVTALVIFLVYDFTINLPKAKAVKDQLEDEFKSIVPLPNGNGYNYKATYGTSQALVTCSYKTRLKYPEIRAYYDSELRKHGWKLSEERSTRDWGNDLGGKSAAYCKGEYRAHLQFAGEQANYGWDYALSLSWGLGPITDKYSDKFLRLGCR